MAKNYVQAPSLYLAGSGTIIGATSITLEELKDIYGNAITSITPFGDKGYITLEPDTSNEEAATFTGVTVNANGTVTLTGIKTILAQTPYTEASGLVRSHAGSSLVVITDNVAFWSTFANTSNDNTFTGANTFSQKLAVGGVTSADTGKAATVDFVNAVAVAGAPDAATTAKGVARLTAAADVTIGTCTITIATPGVITSTAHGLTLNDSIRFTTTGALPTGLVVGTTYFVISAGLTANTFEVSTSLGGSAVNTSGSQSGIHTLIKNTPVAVGQNDAKLNNAIASTGSANAYVVTPTNAYTTYTTGQRYSFISNFANTASATVNFSGLGAKTIKQINGVDNLNANDIISGQVVTMMYDGTNMVYQGGKIKVSQDGAEIYAADAGGTDAYAITLSPAPTAYTTGMVVRFKANTANTGTATLNVNSLGAKTIVKGLNTTLDTGDILASQFLTVIYDGTNFVLQSPTAQAFRGLSGAGSTTYNLNTASGVQNIAHGLGVTPKIFNVQGMLAAAGATGQLSFSLNGQSISFDQYGSGGAYNQNFAFYNDVANNFGATAVITADATNIIITWTRTSASAAGTVYLIWNALA